MTGACSELVRLALAGWRTLAHCETHAARTVVCAADCPEAWSIVAAGG